MSASSSTRHPAALSAAAFPLLSFFGVASFADEGQLAESGQGYEVGPPGHGRTLVRAMCGVATVYVYGPSADSMAEGRGTAFQTDLAIVSRGKLADLGRLATALGFAVRLLPMAHGSCLVAAHGCELVTVYEVDTGGLTNALVHCTGAVLAPSPRAIRLLKLDGGGAVAQRMGLPRSEPLAPASPIYAQCRWMADMVKYGRTDGATPAADKPQVTRDELLCFAIEDLPFLAHAYGPLAGWMVLESLSRIPGTTSRGVDQARAPAQGIIAYAASFVRALEAHAADIATAYAACARIPMIGSFILHDA